MANNVACITFVNYHINSWCSSHAHIVNKRNNIKNMILQT